MVANAPARPAVSLQRLYEVAGIANGQVARRNASTGLVESYDVVGALAGKADTSALAGYLPLTGGTVSGNLAATGSGTFGGGGGFSGDVSIGTTSKNGRLNVNGDANFSHAVLLNNNVQAIRTADSFPSVQGTGALYPAPTLGAGHLIIQSRPTANRDILFVTGATPAIRAGVASDGTFRFYSNTSTTNREAARFTQSWPTSTDGAHLGRLTASVFDFNGAREGWRVEANGSAPLIGFLGASAVARQTVGAAASDAATTQTLANNLRTALINLGLCAA